MVVSTRASIHGVLEQQTSEDAATVLDTYTV